MAVTVNTLCPVCNNNELEEGEWEHMDLGHMLQVTPDHCHFCGYVQPSSYRPGDISLEVQRKCWELQVRF